MASSTTNDAPPFVGEWNNSFDFQLQYSNLLNPTEKMLTSALYCYLRNMNTDIDKIYNPNAIDQFYHVQFKIKFCQHIERLYKISDKSNHFKYFDLLYPTSKTTIHMLKMLWNYYLYCKMIRDETVDKAKKLIDEANQLTELKNQFQIENCKAKEMTKRIDTQLEKSSTEIIKFEQKCIQLSKMIDEITEQTTTNNLELKKMKKNSFDLSNEIDKLKLQTVSQDEYESILSTQQSNCDKLDKLSEVKQETINANTEVSNKIIETTDNIKKIEFILLKYPEDELISSNNLKTQKLNIEVEINQLQMDIEKCQSNIEEKKLELANINEKYNKLVVILNEHVSEDAIQKLRQELSDLEDKNEQILINLDYTTKIHRKLQNEQEILKKNINIIMNHVVNTDEE